MDRPDPPIELLVVSDSLAGFKDDIRVIDAQRAMYRSRRAGGTPALLGFQNDLTLHAAGFRTTETTASYVVTWQPCRGEGS